MNKTTLQELQEQITSLACDINAAEKILLKKGITVPERLASIDRLAWNEPAMLSATLDELFAAIPALEAHLAKLRVDTRLATPLASAPSTATTVTNPAVSREVEKQLLLSGKVSAKKLTLGHEIRRLESQLRGATGLTKTCIERKLSDARAEFARIK
jgi:hypothetical protein